MNIKITFAALGIIIGLIGIIPYIIGLLKKQIEPHVFTWLIWAITQGIATLGILKGEGGIGAYVLMITTSLTFLVFLLSLKNGKKNITRYDVFVLIAACLAMGIWIFLKNPLLAVIWVSIIDILGYIPTFRKSFHKPETEKTISWLFYALGNVFAILALENYNMLTMFYVVSIFFANITLYLFLVVRKQYISTST